MGNVLVDDRQCKCNKIAFKIVFLRSTILYYVARNTYCFWQSA